MKTFCEIIRELREDRDLKQADVAKVLGTSQQYYSKYETGKYEMPIHCVTALADFYGVSTWPFGVQRLSQRLQAANCWKLYCRRNAC